MIPAEPRPRGATRADVAQLAGVSTAVVSYAFNNGPRPIAAATRERVLEAARMLDYRPNAAARALSKGQSDLLALVVPSVEQPYFAHLAAAVETAARDAGLSLIVATGDMQRLAPTIRELIGQQLRGIVLASQATTEASKEFLAARMPTVLVNQVFAIGALQSLGPDYYAGAVEAARHLIEVHGHRRLAYIGYDFESDERGAGWRSALRRAGLDTDAVVEVSFSHAGGRDAIPLLLQQHPDVTAVFCASDQVAIGAIAGLAAAGKRAPDDLAIVSFDGSPEAEFSVPALTTLAVPLDMLAQDAVQQLLGLAENSNRRYELELVIRRSCGCT